MHYATPREKAYWRSLNCGQRFVEDQEERRADLELSPLADLMMTLLRKAEEDATRPSATSDERSLAEIILDRLGSPDDPWAINEVVEIER